METRKCFQVYTGGCSAMPLMRERWKFLDKLLIAWLSKLYSEALSLFTVGWDTKAQKVSFMYTNLCVRVIQQPPANNPVEAHHGLWMNPGSKVPLPYEHVLWSARRTALATV
jgi:hypothetical protein